VECHLVSIRLHDARDAESDKKDNLRLFNGRGSRSQVLSLFLAVDSGRLTLIPVTVSGQILSDGCCRFLARR
jgi:hypothetical protein